MKSLSPSTVALQPAPRSDPAVRLASHRTGSQPELAIDRNWKEAGRAAARVGDDVITQHDLVLVLKEEWQRRGAGQGLPPSEQQSAKVYLAKIVLANMIEESLLVQEAKREIKNPKQLTHLNEEADKWWRREELPPLLRRHMVETEAQLKRIYADSGRSLDAMRQCWRQAFIAHVFLQQKVAGKQKVELPEMLKYYNEHLHDKQFDRPALLTWREIEIEKGRHPSPAHARNKADVLLARLKHGDDFAKLARAESEGPSRVREQGGLMQTSPGSFAVESVNEACDPAAEPDQPGSGRTHQPAHRPGRRPPRSRPCLVRGDPGRDQAQAHGGKDRQGPFRLSRQAEARDAHLDHLRRHRQRRWRTPHTLRLHDEPARHSRRSMRPRQSARCFPVNPNRHANS